MRILKQTKVMFFLLALISASFFRHSEAHTKQCSTVAIDNVPGCFDAIKAASNGDGRLLKSSGSCCTAIRSTLPKLCYFDVYPGKSWAIDYFQTICKYLFPPA
ncbi:unnamed protein product [Thlaspi arvense]|uniref:Prolamin-like domain-containing protein n=1 Tax=Thlaspi arvense TaxID=13288 RepID=A0AAU9T7J4_THLAR|nr:unnamed protein product [Thlaspi arvense]